MLSSKSNAQLTACLMQDPSRSGAGPSSLFAGAAGVLQLRLLEVYLQLPNANAFAPEHEILSKLCARSLRGSSPAVAAAGVQQLPPCRLAWRLSRCGPAPL